MIRGRQGSTVGAIGRDRRWHLEDERDFLLRSLADLDAERAAGDLDEQDYQALGARDRARLAAVTEALSELDRAGSPAPAPAVARPSRRRPRWRLAVAVAALCAGATVALVAVVMPRLPGQPATGSTPSNIPAELDEAAALVDQGTSASLTEALALYRQVLQVDPNQPQALAETGYLEWEAGFSAANQSQERQGRALVERAAAVDPRLAAVHLFLGTMLFEQDHDPRAAVRQYRAFLADHPKASLVASAARLIDQAFLEAGVPKPAGVPAG
jgi:tetratricopeptide (TPR) repeat protein